ncbi:MAG: hypothetical protein PHS14_06570 [Elusimicrobia bacterium]|nr:hypothetical protein [Elusimicrobiota bacterium]
MIKKLMKLPLLAAALGGCLLAGCAGLQPEPGSEAVKAHPWTGRVLVFGTEGYMLDVLGYEASLIPPRSWLITNLPFKTWKGRKAKVEGLVLFAVDNDRPHHAIRLRAIDSGQPIYVPLPVWNPDAGIPPEIYNIPKGTYFEDDIKKLRSLEGTTIWANGTTLKNLWTANSQVAIPIDNAEALRVIQISTETFAHVDAAGTFLVVVKNQRGKTGFFPFQEESIYRQNPIKQSWGKEVVECVKKRNVCMGMPAEALEVSWGKPKEINRTVTSVSNSEQWIYGGTYVYLKSGRVDAWQDSSR